MGNGSWLRRGKRRKDRSNRAVGNVRNGNGAGRGSMLRFEALEDRRMLATFLVNNPGDLDQDGNVVLGTLRWAVGRANSTDGGDTIVFADNVSNISLDPRANGQVLKITQPLSIIGPGPRKLSVNAAPGFRVFDLESGSETQVRAMEISGMTISGGSAIGEDEAGKGGAIFNREALTMTEVVIQGNSAQTGGGGVYTAFGSLTLERSLVIGNSSGGDGGGGILNGRPEAENRPTTTIINSTITGNSAGQWGGGVYNRNGTLNIRHSTITENFAGDLGDGVASHGNGVAAAPTTPPTVPPPPHPPRTVFTNVYSSIIYNNGGPTGSDIDKVGETTDSPPRELNPSITSQGYNLVGTGNATVIDPQPPIPPATIPVDDFAFIDPTDQIVPAGTVVFLQDANGEAAGLQDFGGSTNVFLLEPTGPAIDKGGNGGGLYDQRGRHFRRAFNDPAVPTTPPTPDDKFQDVGAVEMQMGEFEVDTLIDEDNLIYSRIFEIVTGPGGQSILTGDYTSRGNFSLREAIEFASKNPGPDLIKFSDALNSQDLLDDEDLNASPAPTIILELGMLELRGATRDDGLQLGPQFLGDLEIRGPEGFILEIDAVGLDSNPNLQNGTGSRTFQIDDFDPTVSTVVTMSNFTVMGGDVLDEGGAIESFESLVLTQMTFKNNNSTITGGALYLNGGGTVTIDRSTFNNNRAPSNGGAIYLTGGTTLDVTSSTFSSNIAENRGGAIYVNNSFATIAYSTITLNSAGSTLGSGIGVAGATATVDVQSTIISGNVSNDVDFFGSGAADAFLSLGYNLIGRGTASSAFTATGDKRNILDPMLQPLTRQGGLVATHAPTYRPDLNQISPVIDMGDPAAVAGQGGVPDFDQRGEGFLRVFDVLGGGPRIDIGAYELQAGLFLVSHFGDENDGLVGAGNLSLREAIALANLNPLFDVIEFDQNLLSGGQINLSRNLLAPGTPSDIRITSSMRINWLGTGQLLIYGAGLDDPSTTIEGSRLFTVDDGDLTKHINVEFSGNDGGIQFYGAHSPQAGGAFYSRENLTFNDVIFQANDTYDYDESLAGFPSVDQTGLHGGHIYIDGAGQTVRPTLTLERMLITGGRTTDNGADGGALYAVNAVVNMDDSVVTGNSTTGANSDGGAIALVNSTMTISGLTSITGNIAKGGTSDGGGIHFVDGSVLTLNDVVISGNNTQGGNSEGGGLAGVNSQLIVNRSIISENFTLGTQSSGGGIALSGGSATIDASSLRDNTVSGNNSHGGGIWNNGGVLVVRGSSIVENESTHATGKGGGVYSDTNLAGTQSTLIVNSTISGNSADMRGGGIFNADGRTDIRNSTITNNSTTAIVAGGGVASFGNTATTVTSVQNSIIAGNVGTDVSYVDGVASNSFQSLGYNLVGAGNAAGSFTQPGDKGGAPGLAPLADNGRPDGVAFEMLTHALLAGSAAINAGNPAAVGGSGGVPALDQRGATRVRGGRLDIGAYEFPPEIADFDGDADADGNDFLVWQRNVGKTSATKSQGDADDNDVVNGLDLAIWRVDFGSATTSNSTAVTLSSSASSSAFASSEVQSAPAVSDQSTLDSEFSSLASLGSPQRGAAPVRSNEVVQDPTGWSDPSQGPAATSAWDDELFSTFDEPTAFDEQLLEGGAGAEAEDVAFAEWYAGVSL